MDSATAEQLAREFAERLIAFEARSLPSYEGDALAMCRVCEKLRHSLSHLTGPAAFSSLITRALTLAQGEAPVFGAVRVTETGTLEGLETGAAETSAALIAHLIQLLTTFVGQSLTLQLLQNIWPDLPASESTSEKRTRRGSA